MQNSLTALGNTKDGRNDNLKSSTHLVEGLLVK